MPEYQPPPIATIPPDTIRHDGDVSIASLGEYYHYPRATWNRIWEAKAGKGEIVAVLDTGYTPHDLLPEPIKVAQFSNSQTTQDRNGHGNHVAGTIVGRDGIGAAPYAAWICAKVLGDDGTGSTKAIAGAVRWSVDEGATVINMSLGSNRPDNDLYRAIQYADSRGVICVCAAGNAGFSPGRNTIGYPARYLPESLCVGAIDRNRKPTSFSSGGREMDIAAYGDRIVSASHRSRSGLAAMSGTSMAAPVVAGTIAALNSLRQVAGMKRFTGVDDFRDWLRLRTIDIHTPGRDDQTGLGKVDSAWIAEWMTREVTWI